MVDGGLCSVMTKYVLGECFKKHLGADVRYDLTWFKTHGTDTDGNPTRKLSFPTLFPEIDFPEATTGDVKIYRKYFRYINPKPYAYNTGLFSSKRPIYVDGYAENWRYFADVESEVLSNLAFEKLPLSPANQDVMNDIENAEVSVAVHVRRGDYVNLGMFGLGPDYYLSAIRRVKKAHKNSNLKVFFFSDDISWVREKIADKVPNEILTRCVDVNDVHTGHFDLLLISKCQHQISSNSSFGYWGGLLNKNPKKMVIVPARWLPTDQRAPEHEGCDDAHSYPGFIAMENNPGTI